MPICERKLHPQNCLPSTEEVQNFLASSLEQHVVETPTRQVAFQYFLIGISGLMKKTLSTKKAR